MTTLPLLSLLIFTPWAGAWLLALLPRLSARAAGHLALAFSFSTLALGLAVLAGFNPADTTYQFVEDHAWIRALNVHYHLGLDGLSLLLVLLTAIVSPVALGASLRSTGRVVGGVPPPRSAIQRDEGIPPTGVRNPRFFGILFLVLQGSALGVFLALNFFHWFIFWELSLMPAFFLIKLWGGPAAGRAAYQFVIYTLAGSAFMLFGFAAVYAVTGTLDFPELARLGAAGGLAHLLGPTGALLVFLGIFAGLAVKVPLFPFHTWLPAAYAEAPTGVTMFLTSVMSKMGVYGFLRILWPLFPTQLQACATPLLWLALGGVVLGAFAAIKQTDLKRMLAYSSINHLGYCLLALFAVAAHGTGSGGGASAAALNGLFLQLFNHGLSAAALFYCVGLLEQRAGGRRGLADFGGVRSAAPVLAGLCGLAMFSSLGLPGLNGFVGEFLIFLGVFGLEPWAASIATLGLLATALFLLTFWQRVFHGPRAGAAAGEFPDLDRAELATLLPLVALMLVLGVLPHLLTGLFNSLATAWAYFPPLP